MTFRRLLGIAFHLLLAVGLVLPGVAAPAQAARQALAVVAGTPDTMSHASCDGMAMPDTAPARKMPSAPHGCDLASCLGAGCLTTIPHVAAFVPEANVLIAGDERLPPSQVPETPLRPPIA